MKGKKFKRMEGRISRRYSLEGAMANGEEATQEFNAVPCSAVVVAWDFGVCL
jgi:hypothetical protein